MLIDVLLGEAPPVPADVAGRLVVVIDVMRTATTVATALANGAREVIPFESIADAVRASEAFPSTEFLLCGERRMLRIDGFHLGNSPQEYSQEAVKGRTLLYTTSNGTRALAATHGADRCFLTAFVNAAATVDILRTVAGTRDIILVCAGHNGRPAFEDVVCAGRLVSSLTHGVEHAVLTDGARVAQLIERPFANGTMSVGNHAKHVRTLAAAGFLDDVEACLTFDRYATAVCYQDGRLKRYPGGDDGSHEARRVGPSASDRGCRNG